MGCSPRPCDLCLLDEGGFGIELNSESCFFGPSCWHPARRCRWCWQHSRSNGVTELQINRVSACECRAGEHPRGWTRQLRVQIASLAVGDLTMLESARKPLLRDRCCLIQVVKLVQVRHCCSRSSKLVLPLEPLLCTQDGARLRGRGHFILMSSCFSACELVLLRLHLRHF